VVVAGRYQDVSVDCGREGCSGIRAEVEAAGAPEIDRSAEMRKRKGPVGKQQGKQNLEQGKRKGTKPETDKANLPSNKSKTANKALGPRFTRAVAGLVVGLEEHRNLASSDLEALVRTLPGSGAHLSTRRLRCHHSAKFDNSFDLRRQLTLNIGVIRSDSIC
jgi:hypothetical protein